MISRKIAVLIGVALGVAIALPTSFALLTQEGAREARINDISILCEREECLSFYIWGIVKDISADSLTLVQASEAEDNSNSSITLSPFSGVSLLSCSKDDGTECNRITYDEIQIGTLACAHARLNPDGTFNVDRIFFNSVCTTDVPVNPHQNSVAN
ncbi:MAG: hypothetical protein HRF40_05275 [Nitrososphaera sp.]|jgi:hypothetical protein